MQRYKLTVEYDGRPYKGFQRQPSIFGNTVQGEIEKAVFALSNQQITLTAAGRTDAGVHALGQIVHFDLKKTYSEKVMRDALNAFLRPQPIVILKAELVDSQFDARFSALKRHYIYRVINRRPPLGLEQGKAFWVPYPLSLGKMNEGAQHLIGTHDFTTYRASECQAKSPIRSLERLTLRKEGELILFEASARSFLHHQVRSIVGSLIHVGTGKWPPIEIRNALEAKDRKRCGAVAPPEGLYFISVDY